MRTLELDRQFLWHPYATADNPGNIWELTGADGVYLTLADGTKLIDGVSSWWCVCHGHRHPAILESIVRQMEKFTQVMFAGFTHRPAAELAERLIGVAPEGLNRVFWVDSGSIATECAIKMALQYQSGCGRTNRTKMLTVRGGYHGDTTGAMALNDPDGMYGAFRSLDRGNIFAPRPDLDCGELEEIFAQNEGVIAGFILEPLFQGAGGMRFYPIEYLRRARKLCEFYDVPLIFDEVATGFGRLGGELFASQIAGVRPDIMNVGKGLTGGALPLAGVLASKHVSDKVGKFMHGPTFMANPLACAAGIAALELFDAYNWQSQVAMIERKFKNGFISLQGQENVLGIRCMGGVGVIELAAMPSPDKVTKTLLTNNVWLRPLGNYVYAMPPFTVSEVEMDKIVDTMLQLTKI